MFKKVLCAFMIMLLISTGGVLNVDASEIPQCSMTIEQGKHTESSPAKASGICGEKDALWGYYVPNLDAFVVRGMVNRDVTQSGQVFNVPIPGPYQPQLTVYIVRKATEPAPPKEEPKPSNPTPPKEEKPEPKPSNPTPPKEENPAPKPSNPTPPKEEKKETKPSTQKVETQSNSSTSVTNKQTETKNSSKNETNVSVSSTKEKKDDSSVTNKEEKHSSKNTETEGEDENNVEDSEDVEAVSTDDEAAIDNNSSSELEVVESKEKNDDTDSKQSKSFLAELPNSVKWLALPSVLTLSIAGGIYWWFRKKGMI